MWIIIWNFIKTKILALIVAFIIGVLASYTSTLFFIEKKSLTVSCISSQSAGQTVIDIKLQNAGDSDLLGLDANFEFEKQPISLSVSPDKFNKYARIDQNKFFFKIPDNEVLSKQLTIELRFISDGINAIKDIHSLPASFYSTHKISEKIIASKPINIISSYTDMLIIICVVLLSIIVVLLYVVYRLVDLRRKKSTMLNGVQNE